MVVAMTTIATDRGSGSPDDTVSGPAMPPRDPDPRATLGHTHDRLWTRAAVAALLIGTAVLYFWNNTANGWANSFYSAAVQAGSQDWTAFFYGSSDAANSITVDKPPAALWLMALSVRAFGLNSFAILLPEVLLGVASVYVLYRTVRRYFGPGAGLLAGATLAITPVAVLMFRFNNPDALLVFCMTLAAWATLRAITSERRSVAWMSLVGAIIGIAFLTKTLQAFLVVPFFGLAFLICAVTPLRRRILASLAAIAALIVAGGWWVAIVELVPESSRPYIGGSQTNSFLELTFGYNGLGRINGEQVGSVGGGAGGPGGGAGGGMWGETGIWRMFDSESGGQISWLIPAAVVLLIAGLWMCGRAARTDARRATLIVFGGWFLVTFVTFSFMAGIFHSYYTVALAPAIAAMVGMGGSLAWKSRAKLGARIALALAALAAGVWGFVLLTRADYYGDWLRIGVLALGIISAIGFLVLHRIHSRFVTAVVLAALVSGSAGQLAYAATTVNSSITGSIVTAGPGGMGGPGGGGPGGGAPGGGAPGGMPGGDGAQAAMPGGGGVPSAMPGGAAAGADGADGAGGGPGGGMGGLLDASEPSEEVVDALSADADSFTWVAAAVGSQSAAGLQLATELPVMALGGFNGSDPSPTLEQFQQYVADGKVHYVLASSGMGGMQNGGSNDAAEIVAWAQENFTEVTIGDQTFYDLTAPLNSEGA